MSIWSEKYIEEHQREIEESMSLGELLANPSLKDTRPLNSTSSEDILSSGALPKRHHEKKALLDNTRAKRLRAYMEISSKTVAETRGWRIRAAYRMVCYMARIMGDLFGPMTLDSLFNTRLRPDPSTAPFTKPDAPDTVYGTAHIKKWFMAQDGMTYLPPESDSNLEVWCEAYDRLSIFLRIDQGTADEPESGIFGTVGMFNPDTARFLWPTRDELLLYEQELMLTTFDALCESSGQKVEQTIMEGLGYSRPEAVMLVKTALRYGTAVYAEDFDMSKIRELKSLEVIADTAKAGEDPRAALAARKQLQLVAGLTKTSESEDMDDFRELATKALEDDDIKLLE